MLAGRASEREVSLTGANIRGSGQGNIHPHCSTESAHPTLPVQREADKNEEAETGKRPERSVMTASVSSVHVTIRLFRSAS